MYNPLKINGSPGNTQSNLEVWVCVKATCAEPQQDMTKLIIPFHMTWHIILYCVIQTDQYVLFEEAKLQKSNDPKIRNDFKNVSPFKLAYSIPKHTLHISLEAYPVTS